MKPPRELQVGWEVCALDASIAVSLPDAKVNADVAWMSDEPSEQPRCADVGWFSSASTFSARPRSRKERPTSTACTTGAPKKLSPRNDERLSKKDVRAGEVVILTFEGEVVADAGADSASLASAGAGASTTPPSSALRSTSFVETFSASVCPAGGLPDISMPTPPKASTCVGSGRGREEVC